MEKQNDFGRLLGDETGATMLEFAFVAPPLILMIMGMLDLGHQVYTASVLQGTLQQSARRATLESGFGLQTAIDQRITDSVKTIMPNADVVITRNNFQNFSDVVTPEEYIEASGDNICNNGETYEDLNNNSMWDRNRGRSGLGGANDAVVFNAKVTYQRMFPVASLIGLSDEVELTAQTVLRNQPYNQQATRSPTERTCS
jgi:Flp pilus assembly pilin Flp